MKAAPVLRALAARGIEQRLVHTGQHYDDTMSAVFFRDLDLPQPDLDLGVGSGSHAAQTAAIMVALERAFGDIQPALTVVYGDVNSTLAAAVVASKIGLPVAHVEAGLRSFDDSMPEEINRRVTDLLSELLFVTSPEGVDNLVAMGTPARNIHFVGNPMIDTLLGHLDRFDAARNPIAVLCTQRAERAQDHQVERAVRDFSLRVPHVVLPQEHVLCHVERQQKRADPAPAHSSWGRWRDSGVPQTDRPWS